MDECSTRVRRFRYYKSKRIETTVDFKNNTEIFKYKSYRNERYNIFVVWLYISTIYTKTFGRNSKRFRLNIRFR